MLLVVDGRELYVKKRAVGAIYIPARGNKG